MFKLNVMTYNIRHGRGLDGKVGLDRIAEVIQRQDVDIVALNEVDEAFSRRSNYVQQANWLANFLEMDFVFGPSLVFGNRKYGNAILSRSPITNFQNYVFHAPFAEPRCIVKATINDIHVLASHFSIHPVLQKKQIDFCMNYENTPCIILGDLNRSPNSSSYNRLTQRFIDCHAKKPLATYPAKNPRSRLDYIFISDDFTVLDVNVIHTAASDHLPVCATLGKDCI